MEESPKYTRNRRPHDDSTGEIPHAHLPRRMSDDSSFDIDSSDHSHVFDEDVLQEEEKTKKTGWRISSWLIIGVCFLFLFATINIYYVINENEEMARFEDEIDFNNDKEFLAMVEEAVEEIISETENFSDPIPEEDEIEKDDFIIESKEISIEAFKTEDGLIHIPDDVILNPHARDHWFIIEAALNVFDDYDDDYEDSIGMTTNFEEQKLMNENENEDEFVLNLPQGLKYTPPPVNDGEHVHTHDCDPVAADIVEEEDLQLNETEEEYDEDKIKMPDIDNL